MTSGYELLYRSGVDINFWDDYILPSVMHIKGSKCEECGSKDNLDLHHTRYDIQTIQTILLLCRSCHKKWHLKNGSAEELMQKYGVVHPEQSDYSSYQNKEVQE